MTIPALHVRQWSDGLLWTQCCLFVLRLQLWTLEKQRAQAAHHRQWRWGHTTAWTLGVQGKAQRLLSLPIVGPHTALSPLSQASDFRGLSRSRGCTPAGGTQTLYFWHSLKPMFWCSVYRRINGSRQPDWGVFNVHVFLHTLVYSFICQKRQCSCVSWVLMACSPGLPGKQQWKDRHCIS